MKGLWTWQCSGQEDDTESSCDERCDTKIHMTVVLRTRFRLNFVADVGEGQCLLPNERDF